MATVLPAKSDGTQRFDYTSVLDGVRFGLEFSWNSMRSFWSLVISDAAGNVLLRRRLVVGVQLTARFKDARLPYGELMAFDTGGADQDPGLLDLGNRVQLVYLPLSELAAS